MNFNVCNRFRHKELNEFYGKFKNDLFDIIEKYLNEKENNNTNTNINKDNANEKYNGTAGIISIKNILTK